MITFGYFLKEIKEAPPGGGGGGGGGGCCAPLIPENNALISPDP